MSPNRPILSFSAQIQSASLWASALGLDYNATGNYPLGQETRRPLIWPPVTLKSR